MQFYKRSVLVSRFTEETVSKSSSRRSVTLRHVTCKLFASCRTPRESDQHSGSFVPFMRGTKATSSLKQAGSLTKTTLTLRVRGGTGWSPKKNFFHLTWETPGSLDLFVPAFSRRFRSRPPSVLSLCAKMDPCESLGSRSGRDRCHLRDVVTTSDTDNLPEGMVQMVNDMVEGSGKRTNHCGIRVG